VGFRPKKPVGLRVKPHRVTGMTGSEPVTPPGFAAVSVKAHRSTGRT